MNRHVWTRGWAVGVAAAAMVAVLLPAIATAQTASITTEKTVGLDPMLCAPTSSLDLPPEGGMVTYCFQIMNDGDRTFSLLDLVDTELGVILSSFPYSLTPGASAFVTQSALITATTTNFATWNATALTPTEVVTSTDSALVTVAEAAPALALEKTVGTDPEVCAPTDAIVLPAGGGPVVYCFRVTNTGNVTFTSHDLVDSELGTLLSDHSYSLSPNASVFLTSSAVITETTSNTATWTAVSITPSATVTVADSALVSVPPPDPALELVKTVGTDPGACAASTSLVLPPGGGPVVYCFRATNTGNVTFTSHDLVDSELGTLLNDFAYSLAPSASVFLTSSAVITETTANTASWSAVSITPATAITSTASALVTVTAPNPAIALVKTVGTDPGSCATTAELFLPPGGGAVVYCYEVTNVGNITFTTHDLVDDQLGAILSSFPYTLVPGASVSVTEAATVTETTTNVATWTASGGGFGEATDASEAVVTVMERRNIPTLSTTAVLVFALLLGAAGLLVVRRIS